MISRSKCSCRLAISTRGNSFSWQKSCAASRMARSSSVSGTVEPQRVVPGERRELACGAGQAVVVHASVSLSSAPCGGAAGAQQHEGGHVVAEADNRRAEVVVAAVAVARLGRSSRRAFGRGGRPRAASARARLSRGAVAARSSARAARGAARRGAADSGRAFRRRTRRLPRRAAGLGRGAPCVLPRFASPRLGRPPCFAAPPAAAAALAAVASRPSRRVQPLDDRPAGSGGRSASRSPRRPAVVRRGEREGASLQPGPAGAADAVHIVLGMDRHVEIEHVRQAADVDAARRHVAAAPAAGVRPP